MLSKVNNIKRTICCKTYYTLPNEIIPNLTWEKFQTLSHRKRINLFLNSAQHLQDIKHYIPKKYMELKKNAVADNLYLIDTRIASHIAKHILPFIKDRNSMVCETNAGLGFLTSELLDGGLQQIRLYETCSEFRLTLKEFSNAYPGKVELFVKDIFHIWKMSYLDKVDKGCRVTQFLKGVPKRNWCDDTVLIIIGTMSKLDFISYMFKMISLQNEIAAHGRIELFVIMRPGDYIKLTAGPQCDLHTYQRISVFANIFCELKLIEKYPRIAFLPWESTGKVSPHTKSFKKYDLDNLYLVHIKFKRELPMKTEHLLPFYFFVKQVFGRGNVQLIQKLENWISGVGQNVLLPSKSENSLDVDIFTRSGQMTPLELLEIFKILYNHPGYLSSTLMATVEAELLKYETVETDVAEIHSRYNPSHNIK